MKRFFAFLKIKQDIKRGNMHQNQVLLEKAKNMSLANNFVTDLTSLVVVIDDGSRNSNQNAFRSGGSGTGCTGMCTPIDDGLDISSLISPEENSAVISSCNITLYSDEFYQGESLTFSSSVPDLSVWDFEEKLVSVKVEGTCQWKIFTGEKNNNLFLPLYFFVQTNHTLESRRSSHRLRRIGRRKVLENSSSMLFLSRSCKKIQTVEFGEITYFSTLIPGFGNIDFSIDFIDYLSFSHSIVWIFEKKKLFQDI